MPHGATFESFQSELSRLVEIFGRNLTAYKSAGSDEASLRQEFLNPLFRALGWDIAQELLALVPKLRLARTETERAALQNAVTATDQQIDALIYELYGLTEDEISLVEGQEGS